MSPNETLPTQKFRRVPIAAMAVAILVLAWAGFHNPSKPMFNPLNKIKAAGALTKREAYTECIRICKKDVEENKAAAMLSCCQRGCSRVLSGVPDVPGCEAGCESLCEKCSSQAFGKPSVEVCNRDCTDLCVKRRAACSGGGKAAQGSAASCMHFLKGWNERSDDIPVWKNARIFSVGKKDVLSSDLSNGELLNHWMSVRTSVHKWVPVGQSRVMFLFANNAVVTAQITPAEDSAVCRVTGMFGPTNEGNIHPKVVKSVRENLHVAQECCRTGEPQEPPELDGVF